ncbi:MAG TPA: ABC transporter permease [Gaiellaceae bacterium]|nr:ABC transporter permease [Gaiellaceae bacterium]
MTSAGPSTAGLGTRRRGLLLHGITGFVLRRSLLGLLTLFLVSIVVFAATQALPGDAARAILGRTATPDSLAALRKQLHLGEPMLQQYVHWLGRFLRGDLGNSLAANEPVTTLLGTRIENSAVLVFLSALISTPLAIVLGAVSARRRDRPFDHAASITMLTLAALPEFVVGLGLVVLFGTTVFKILPAVSLIAPNEAPWTHPKDLILPTLTLVIAVCPYTARIMRASMVEVLESDYVEMARLKGLAEQRVVWRHAVPNAIAPTIQVTALNLAYLAGGIVVVEYVFGYAGVGSALVDAVHNRDVPVVQALALMIAAIYIVLNVVADVAAILVSPRLRTSLK